jgi:putative transferase (TIGR04331 family)
MINPGEREAFTMAKDSKFLITTGDERTWRSDVPVIFLGDWCLSYNRRHIWEEMDYELAAPFGLSQAQRDSDLAEVKRITSALLEEVAQALNEVHGESYNSNYWNIILGNWLGRYVSVCYNRYFNIVSLLETTKISETSVFRIEKYSHTVSSSSQFIHSVNQSAWNNAFYFKVLEALDFVDFNFIELETRIETEFFSDDNIRAKPGIKQTLRSLLTRYLPRFSRETDALIINSYLPLKEEIKLHLRLMQVPQLRTIQHYQTSSVNPLVRDKLLFNGENFEGFERFIRDQLIENIPTCFIEGYGFLKKAAMETHWPSTPKFIFTSSNFDTDEVFKVWTAEKVEQGCPYYIGQHGNNYGTSKLTANNPEFVYPERFISWGWSKDSSKVTPGFIFKVANKPKSMNPNGGLLFISNCVEHMLYTYDSTHEFKNFQLGQFEFLSGLKSRIQEQVTVRLHSGWKSTGWNDDIRWQERFPEIHLDLGNTKIDDLLAKNRIAVHGYDSTGILEGLASNVPTLAFWEGDFEYLLPEARSYYEDLRRAGIIHLDANTASTHINEHWDDIAGWWNSEHVQLARISFCEKYARNVSRPSKVLKQLLS